MSDERLKSGSTGSGRRIAGRLATVVVASVVLLTIGASPAFARPAPANPPKPTGAIAVSAGATTVVASGSWTWPVGTNTKAGQVDAHPGSAKSECGNNYGVGWGIAWGDSHDPGLTIKAKHAGHKYTLQVGDTAAGDPDGSAVQYDSSAPCGTFSATALSGTWSAHHTYAAGTALPSTICVVSYVLKNAPHTGHGKQYKVNTNQHNSFKTAVKMGLGPTFSSSSACFDPAQLKASPTIVTTATNATVGSAISDTATLSGTASVTLPGSSTTPASGTVTFTLYGPTDTSCSATPIYTSAPLTVSGDGTYGPVSFTPTQGAGSYRWIATYSGDAGNNGATELCGASGETSTLSTTAVTNPTNPSTSPSSSVPVVTTATSTKSASGSSSTTPTALTGATTVHTGEPWAGSRPFVLGVIGLGLTLLGLGYYERRRLTLRRHDSSRGRSG